MYDAREFAEILATFPHLVPLIEEWARLYRAETRSDEVILNEIRRLLLSDAA